MVIVEKRRDDKRRVKEERMSATLQKSLVALGKSRRLGKEGKEEDVEAVV